MERIVILSDSLALPRTSPEVTKVEDTYPYLLRDNYEVFQFSKGGGVIHELREQAHYYCQYEPDYVILQSGIVDCAPRAYTFREEKVFELFRPIRAFRRILSKTITTRRLRGIRKRTWTKISDFKNECRLIVDQFPNAKCFALSILPACKEYEKIVPGITKNIVTYNDALKELFGVHFIDLSDIPADCIMTDHHHLNKKGQLFVKERIENALLK